MCVHVYLSHPMGEPNTGKVVDILTSIGRSIGSELNLLLVHAFVAQAYSLYCFASDNNLNEQ